MKKACQKECIVQKKKVFCFKYNPKNTEDMALSSGISAAVKRLKVYNEDYRSKRREIHIFWKEQLKSLGKKYKNPQNLKTFENDVVELQKRMNRRYKTEFTHSGISSGLAGFRIAQAQKSLSVYLKHLWCMGKIVTPPVCPIDFKVLTVIGKTGLDARWGYINTMEEYVNRLDWIEAYVKNNKPDFTIAEWELLVF